MKRYVVTIDGPAGAGKTTVSSEVAKRLGYTYVDTGALYRGVALAVRDENCPVDDEKLIGKVLENLSLQFENNITGSKLLLNGKDVTDQIRTHEITMLASLLSAKEIVRSFLLDIQRELGRDGGVVFEGRDMGTVVFPHADVKFFLDADSKVRALRRHKELIEKGCDTSLDDVQEAMRKRDRNDSERALAPLRPAKDAIRVDSTRLDLDAVVNCILESIPIQEK